MNNAFFIHVYKSFIKIRRPFDQQNIEILLFTSINGYI